MLLNSKGIFHSSLSWRLTFYQYFEIIAHSSFLERNSYWICVTLFVLPALPLIHSQVLVVFRCRSLSLELGNLCWHRAGTPWSLGAERGLCSLSTCPLDCGSGLHPPSCPHWLHLLHYLSNCWETYFNRGWALGYGHNSLHFHHCSNQFGNCWCFVLFSKPKLNTLTALSCWATTYF